MQRAVQLRAAQGGLLNMNIERDEDVMLQVRHGAEERLGVLFDRYQSPLLNFYSKLTGNRAVSEDLVQEVFLRVLKYRQSYTPDAPFRAWIYQIARNVRFDHLRKNPIQAEFKPEMSPAFVPPDATQKDQETQLLHAALLRMPEEKRELLVLARLQEMKYEEIARLLNCEVGTVKVRVHRALHELRAAFIEVQNERRAASRGKIREIPPHGAGQSGASQ